MDERLRIGQLRVRATGLDRTGAQTLGEHIATGLRDGLAGVETRGRLDSLRIKLPATATRSGDLGQQIAQAILRSLR